MFGRIGATLLCLAGALVLTYAEAMVVLTVPLSGAILIGLVGITWLGAALIFIRIWRLL